MILRKPYAFLIKYFKIIHIGLFLMFGYLLFKLREIYIFFQDYVRNDVYTYMENMASEYITPIMFVIAGLILISGIAIFYLMKEKEKPVVFYGFLIGYSFCLIISLIACYDFYVSLEFELYDRAIISIYRDIMGFVYYIVYFFLALSFVRGFGFDIKKFRFDKDLKVLNIKEEDSEEFEVGVNVDKENIVNALRKERRLMTYYLKENALTLSIILIIFLVISGTLIYQNIVTNYVVYNEQDSILANNLEYIVNQTYYTNKNKYNETLNASYLIVDFTVINQSINNNIIDLKKTRLKINNDYFYPVINRYDAFKDLGVGYQKDVLKSLTTNQYILVFKLEDSLKKRDKIILEVFDREEYKNNELKIYRQRIRLNPSQFEKNDYGIFQLNDEITLDKSLLKKGQIQILDYEIQERFIYEYEECREELCEKYKKVIQSKFNYPILKINWQLKELSLEELQTYMSIEYKIDNQLKTIDETDFNILYNDFENIFIEGTVDFAKASEIILKINIRESIYVIRLK